MQRINIKETLLIRLKNDYEETEAQTKFFNGLDYLEAMVKFFGVLNISVVKNIDKDMYNKIFLSNFKISPSLGDFKSLATQAFTKSNKKELFNKDKLYDKLCKLFTLKDLKLDLDMADNIVEDNIKENKKKISALWNLFEEYVVNFRNKLKGHGASFSSVDTEQSQIILNNLNNIIKTIESKIDILLTDENLINNNFDKIHT